MDGLERNGEHFLKAIQSKRQNILFDCYLITTFAVRLEIKRKIILKMGSIKKLLFNLTYQISLLKVSRETYYYAVMLLNNETFSNKMLLKS